MSKLKEIKMLLRQSATVPKEKQAYFFKTGQGEYAAFDKFLGITVPALRTIAKKFSDLQLSHIQALLKSAYNEERLVALMILTHRYARAGLEEKNELYAFYLFNLPYINNWNLVDASAHLIVGMHLFKANKSPLLTLAKSPNLWERRIAIVATWYFIRQNELSWTFKIAKLLLKDEHDLIHKAVGWMLREAGKRNSAELEAFLDQYAALMPRTMLRYAIEKFPEQQRKAYLNKKRVGTC